jgi:cholesterol transport system auxiliary component
MRTPALLALLVLACSGCASTLLGPNGEVLEVYRLEVTGVAGGAGRLPLVLAVSRPRAAPSLDTARIAVVQPDNRFDYFAGMRWSDAAPQMLQPLLVDALQSGGRYEAVLAAPSRAAADRLLEVELRRFEAAYAAVGAAPRVRVEMHATLVDARRGQRISSVLASAEAEAAANQRGEVVAAFGRATVEAIGDIVTWLGSVEQSGTD